jgi:hypothetical protein
VTVTFPGTIPTTSGTIQLTDQRYNPAPPISTSLTADVTPPSCTVTNVGVDANGRKFVQITVQDTGSGIAAVNPNEQVNLIEPISIPSYSAGVLTPLVVTATKNDQTQSSQIGLEVDDVAGNVTDCDPILTEVGRDGPGGLPRTATFHHVAHGESHVLIANQTPGLTEVTLVVNGKRFPVHSLDDGEMRNVDVSKAMRENANNTITIIAQGKPRGSAVILISDSP